MKNLVEKPNLVKTVMDSKPVRAISATARNWTVTDVETHNPSVHSDNSTGSTSGSWIITPQRPSSAMSVDGDTASVNSKVFLHFYQICLIRQMIALQYVNTVI